jgi:hypothetical protein
LRRYTALALGGRRQALVGVGGVLRGARRGLGLPANVRRRRDCSTRPLLLLLLLLLLVPVGR